MQMNPPVHAYRDGQAYVVISNPGAEQVVIWSLLVEREARGHGLAQRCSDAYVADLGRKIWHVPAICPEEFEKVFERAGFEKETFVPVADEVGTVKRVDNPLSRPRFVTLLSCSAFSNQGYNPTFDPRVKHEMSLHPGHLPNVKL